MQDSDWKILVSLHSTHSITRSAEQLYLSQPALSKRLRAIEAELGCALVSRSHTGLAFTPQGEQVVAHAKKLMLVLDDLHADISRYQSGAAGSLSLGVPYCYVRFVLPALLQKYTALYPDVVIDITTAVSDDLVQSVREGLSDVCFVRFDCNAPDLEQEQVGENRCYAVYNRPFALKELATLPYIFYSNNSATVAAYDAWWAARFDAPPKLRLRVPNGDACLSMIQQGLGYGIFFDSAYFAKDPSLFAVPLVMKDGDEMRRRTWMLYPKATGHNPNIDRFLAVARDFFGLA